MQKPEADPNEGPWLLRTTQFSDLDRFPMAPTGKMTLLGDSAHAMFPDKGLGGNNALEDARLLSALLTDAPNPNSPGLIEQTDISYSFYVLLQCKLIC